MMRDESLDAIHVQNKTLTPQRALELQASNHDKVFRKHVDSALAVPPESFVNNILVEFPDNDQLNLSLFYENYEKSTIMLKAWNDLFYKGLDSRYHRDGQIFSWQNCIDTAVLQ